MIEGCFKGVSVVSRLFEISQREFQRRFKDVRDVSMVFQEVSSVFQKVFMIFQGRLKGVLMEF